MADKLSLEILIKTIADARGLQTTEQQVKQLAGELEKASTSGNKLEVSADEIAGRLQNMGEQATAGAEQTSKATKQTGQSVNQLGENFEKGAAAGRVMSQALQGNISAIFQLGPAIKALGALLKTNLVGVLITIGALAAQVFVPMIKGFVDAKKGLDATAEAAKKADASLQLRKDAVDGTTQSITALGAEADKTEKKLLAVQRRMDEIAESERDLKIAQVRADPNLSDEERSRQISAITAESEAAKAKRTDDTLKGVQDAHAKAAAEAQQIVADLEAEQAQLAKDSNFAATALTQRREEAASARSRAAAARAATGPGERPGGAAAAAAAARVADKNLADAEELVRFTSERSQTLAEQLAAARKAAAAAAEAAEERETEIAAEREKNATVQQRRAEIVRVEQRAATQSPLLDRRTAISNRLSALNVQAQSEAAEGLESGVFGASDSTLQEISRLKQEAAELERTLKETSSKSAESIQTAANTMSEAAKTVPPPLDATPITTSVNEFGGRIIEMQNGNVAAIGKVVEQVTRNNEAITQLNQRLNQVIQQMSNSRSSR
jgi:hypothetical protein